MEGQFLVSRSSLFVSSLLLATALNCGDLAVKDGMLPCSKSTRECPAPFVCHKDNLCWRAPELRTPAIDGGTDVADDRVDASLDGEGLGRDAFRSMDSSPEEQQLDSQRSEHGPDLAENEAGSDGRMADSIESIDSTPPRTFGSMCETDDECRAIGPAFYCLKVFQELTIPGGLCTRPCTVDASVDPPTSKECANLGACISETSGLGHDPVSACLPTCKADVPCRSGFKCQFVYRMNMLVEPSVCAPDP